MQNDQLIKETILEVIHARAFPLRLAAKNPRLEPQAIGLKAKIHTSSVLDCYRLIGDAICKRINENVFDCLDSVNTNVKLDGIVNMEDLTRGLFHLQGIKAPLPYVIVLSLWQQMHLEEEGLIQLAFRGDTVMSMLHTAFSNIDFFRDVNLFISDALPDDHHTAPRFNSFIMAAGAIETIMDPNNLEIHTNQNMIGVKHNFGINIINPQWIYKIDSVNWEY